MIGMETTKRPSGGASLKASGRKPMLIGLLPEIHAELREIATALDRPMTSCAVEAIRQWIERHRKKLGK